MKKPGNSTVTKLADGAAHADAAPQHSDVDALRKAYTEGRLILFAGAGVSAGLGLPTWQELVNEMARQLGYDPAEFSAYGDYRALAEYFKLKVGMEGLHRWMAQEWHRPDIDIRTSTIHRLIVQSSFHKIYTTNFDRWIEAAHDAYGTEYVKISNVRDLAKATDGVRQIVKFHGDLDDGPSIVLDETSYFERLSFESPLDIKLRADLLGHSVLFIGYSISDTNIRLLFYKLSRMWDQSDNKAARPSSYWFSPKPNPVAQAVLGQWGINMLFSSQDEPGAALLDFMQQLVGQVTDPRRDRRP